MIPMRPMLVALVVLSALVAAPVTAVWPAGEPQFSSEPDGSPAYTSFVRHLNVNIHAWWQREGQRQVPPTQRWRVGVIEIGQGRERGIGVWVRRLGAPPAAAYPGGPEWRSEQVFMLYPLSDRLIEPSATLASAAVIEFLRGQASDTAVGEERKR